MRKPGAVALNVLVVEDEYFIAREIVKALEDVGLEVVGPAGTIGEARQMLAAMKPDCAILDINLHGEMIFSFADELTEESVPFVFATGYDALVVPERYRDIPRWEKPFDPQALSAALLLRMDRR